MNGYKLIGRRFRASTLHSDANDYDSHVFKYTFTTACRTLYYNEIEQFHFIRMPW